MSDSFRPMFNQVAAMLKADYPEALAKTLFLNLSSPLAPDLLEAWKNDMPKPVRDFMSRFYGEDHTTRAMEHAGFVLRIFDRTVLAAIAMKDERSKMVPFLSPVDIQIHEAGHLITHKGRANPWPKELPSAAERDRQSLTREIAADTFMALTEIKYGLMDDVIVAAVAQNRAFNAWAFNDLSHHTGLALKALLKRETFDGIQSMTPRQIADKADAYAEEFTPSPQEFALTHAMYNHAFSILCGTTNDDGPIQQKDYTASLLYLARAGASAPKGSFLFETVKHSVSEVLRHDFSVLKTDDKEWEDIRAVFRASEKKQGDYRPAP